MIVDNFWTQWIEKMNQSYIYLDNSLMIDEFILKNIKKVEQNLESNSIQ